MRQRMMVGRGITDEGWIRSSVDYNEYFKTHHQIGDMSFETCDMEGKELSQVVEEVKAWVERKWRECI